MFFTLAKLFSYVADPSHFGLILLVVGTLMVCAGYHRPAPELADRRPGSGADVAFLHHARRCARCGPVAAVSGVPSLDTISADAVISDRGTFHRLVLL